jgi:ferritin
MLNPDFQKVLNEQVKQEYYSSYLYLAMAAYCDSLNLAGFSHWMRLQADEEREHAMRFYDYILDRGGKVALQALPQPPSDFGSPVQVFEQALAHEQEVTSMIHDLYRRASVAQDHASQVFLQGFITEQVEEERTATQILETLRMAGEDKTALLLVDRELAARSAGGPAVSTP